jgi:hypothetical protein
MSCSVSTHSSTVTSKQTVTHTVNQADEGAPTAGGIPCGQHVLYTADECGVLRAWNLQQCLEQLGMRAAPESALPRSKNNYNARRRLTRTGDEQATDDGETDNCNELKLNNDNVHDLKSEHHTAAAKHAKRQSAAVHESHSAVHKSSSVGTSSSEHSDKQHAGEVHRAKRQSAPASNAHIGNRHESNGDHSSGTTGAADAMQQHRLAAQSLIANMQHEHTSGDTSDALQAERSSRAHTYSNGSGSTATDHTGKHTKF